MSLTEKIPLILDGDPGHDDAIAWVLAKGSGAFDILAVTTAAGNQTIGSAHSSAFMCLWRKAAQGRCLPTP